MKYFLIPTSLVQLHRGFVDAFTTGEAPSALIWATRAIGKNKGAMSEMVLFSGKDSKDFVFNAVIYRNKTDADVSIIGFSEGVDEREIFGNHLGDPEVTEATEEQFDAMKNKALNVMMDL